MEHPAIGGDDENDDDVIMMLTMMMIGVYDILENKSNAALKAIGVNIAVKKVS